MQKAPTAAMNFSSQRLAAPVQLLQNNHPIRKKATLITD